ncbi:lactonase family protein [Aerococcus sp. JJEM-2022b]|uniref:lactonase family protein n=1 Tax=Aerococcus mictus TaxID=2976810 RepID=UPI00227B49C2|nr:lactonase family protein [Aerococcus mictus]MCY3077392.1 lactonase family protein [Aerococcus mictus]
MEKIYLAGYTRQDNQGIHLLKWDSHHEEIKGHELIISESNPTYLALSSDGKELYTLTDQPSPGVNHYRKEGQDFVFVDHCAFLEHNGCYLALDEERQLLLNANYHEGTLALIKIHSDGQLQLQQIISRTGQGPHPNQESSHCHYFNTSPDGKYYLACDLGTDSVISYQFDQEGQLQEKASYQCQAGTGPRHLVFHPKDNILYVIGELSHTIDILTYDDGHFSFVDRVNCLPETYSGENSSAAIRISQDGNFLYVSNRGYNSLEVFEVSKEGSQLSHIQSIPSGGDFPRDFNFDANQSHVIVGHQKEKKVTFFKRDQNTGQLNPLNVSCPINEIVCVQ